MSIDVKEIVTKKEAAARKAGIESAYEKAFRLVVDATEECPRDQHIGL